MRIMKKMSLLMVLITLLIPISNPIQVMASEVRDLKIEAFDSFTLTAGDGLTTQINFSGLGIAAVTLAISGTGLYANLYDYVWKPYPETCTAKMDISTGNDFSGGSIEFQLLGADMSVIQSHTIQIHNKNQDNNVADLNIEMPTDYSMEKGKSGEIKVNFSGLGISSVDLYVSGEGLNALIQDVTWKAYPEICTAILYINTSDYCNGGTVSFRLNGNDSSILKSQDIQIQTYINQNSMTQSAPQQEQINLKEKKIARGYYIIHSKLDDTKVIDVSNVSMSERAYIQLWSNYMNSNQIWYVSPASDGYYTLTAVHSKMKLDVANGFSSNGTTVWQYSDNSSDAQKYKFFTDSSGYVYIQPKCAPFSFLDVSGGNTSNGTQIQVYERNYTDAQKWKFEKIGTTENSIKPVYCKGSITMDCELDVDDVGKSAMEAAADDIKEMYGTNIISHSNLLSNLDFSKFMQSEMPSLFDACQSVYTSFDLLPTFNGTVGIPQCVSIMMNQNNYNKPDGMMFEVEDGDYKTTYTAYVTKMYNAYDIVVFEVREKKSWGTWKIEYIRLIGGFNTSLST